MMATKPSEWRPVETTSEKIGEQFVPTGGVYTAVGVHFKGKGRAALINDNNPTGSTKIDLQACIICFLEDSLTTAGVPISAINPSDGKPYDQKWGVRSYDWEGEMRRVEFRNIKKEHGDYEQTCKNRRWINCFFHDIGSQAIQIRPEAKAQHLQNLANEPCLHRVEQCLVWRCGNAWGTRPSHSLKWFAFERLDGSFEPSLTDVEIVETYVLHPGGDTHGSNGQYESYGAIMSQARHRFAVLGGKVDLVKPEYPALQFTGVENLVIDGLALPRGDNEIQLADMDTASVTITGCTGSGTIKMGHVINGHFSPDVFKNLPMSQGYVQ